jgi:hypothetical protein
MRRLLSGSLGLGLALSAANAAAQGYNPPPSPANVPRPAARLVAVQAQAPIDPAGLTIRSQMSNPAPQPMPPGGGTPMNQPMGVAPPPGNGTQPPAGSLGMPRPFATGPGVTEYRNGMPPAATFTTPVPGPAYPVASPFDPIQAGPVGPVAGPPVALPVNGGLFPYPDVDAPLFGGSYPGGLAAATSALNKWWISAEYLLWWTKSARVPPLLTTSSPPFNGILGQGDTRIVFGDESFQQTLHSGGRFGIGYWFGTDQRWGAEGSIFFLGRNGQGFTTDSAEYPVLARPFINLNTNQPFSQLIASPGLAFGIAEIQYENTVWGAEANARRFLTKTNCSRLDLIGGFRFLQVNEQLNISEFFARSPGSPLTVGAPMAIAGTVTDMFRTENDFYGGQFGLLGETRRGRWFATVSGKVALGTVYQSSFIHGRQNITFSDGTFGTFAGGLLALPGANIGTHRQTRFAVLPEVGVNIGYHITPHMRIFLGYNFLYLSSVLRPGHQIDQGLDVTRIPNFPVPDVTPLPQPRPLPTMRDSDFFAQGLSFGLQFTW